MPRRKRNLICQEQSPSKQDVDKLTEDIEHEANEAMMSRKRQQDHIHQQNMLKVVDDAFTVQEVHGCRKKVPIERLARIQALGPAGNVCDSDNLLERNDLNRRDDCDHVYVSREERDEEAGHHDEGPYRASDKGLFLLFVVGYRWNLRLAKRLAMITMKHLEITDRTSSAMLSGFFTSPLRDGLGGSECPSLASEELCRRWENLTFLFLGGVILSMMCLVN